MSKEVQDLTGKNQQNGPIGQPQGPGRVEGQLATTLENPDRNCRGLLRLDCESGHDGYK